MAQAPCFEESLLVQEIQRGVMLDALEDHELPEFRSEEWLWQALVLAVRDNARAMVRRAPWWRSRATCRRPCWRRLPSTP